jgi:hypothetical protein
VVDATTEQLLVDIQNTAYGANKDGWRWLIEDEEDDEEDNEQDDEEHDDAEDDGEDDGDEGERAKGI